MEEREKSLYKRLKDFGIHKKEPLKNAYYRIFFILIVIPILLIILVSVGIIRAMMVESAVENIYRAQENMVSTLGSEVKDVSIRLSHFVYVNDNEIIRNAAKMDTDDVAERYHYSVLLQESFNYAMIPAQNILSASFYMKSGNSTFLKDSITIPEEEMKAADWYQQALKEPNIIKIGFYDSSVTSSRRAAKSFTIVAALSPGINVDRDGVIEMVTLVSSSQLERILREYHKEELLGKTVILDKDGRVIYDEAGVKELLPDRKGNEWKEGSFTKRSGGKNYRYVVSREGETGCYFVSIIRSSLLTEKFTRVAFGMLAVTSVILALFYIFSTYFLRRIVNPVHHVVEGMKQVEKGNLQVHLEPEGQAEIRTMVHSFNRMVRRLKQLMEENEEQQKKKHEAEIQALQMQINPHFLVNSLNSIRFMAQVSKFEGIRKMAEALINILSASFRSNSGYYTVKEELNVLDSFVYLMKIRYSDGFDVCYHVDESCMGLLIPRLILQPIVENSIVHGFSELVEELGEIQITVKKEENFLVFVIRDNGKGMTDEEIENLLSGKPGKDSDHTGIGVMNVYMRLKLNYGQECGLTVDSRQGKYTETTMRLPINALKEKEDEEGLNC